MKRLWVFFDVALGLGGAVALGQGLDAAGVNEVFDRYRAAYGAAQVIEAQGGLLVVEVAQEGSTVPGSATSALYVTKFADGDTTCYVLQHQGENNAISCVK